MQNSLRHVIAIAFLAVFFMFAIEDAAAQDKNNMSKTPHIYIIHGYGASPDAHWFPWLKGMLEKDGFSVDVLAMPTPLNPDAELWGDYLKDHIQSPTEDTYFVAHSLGVITLLHYMSSLPDTTKIGGYVLVSGFSEQLPTLPQLNAFTNQPPDFDKIKAISPHRAVFLSDNDTIVPPDMTKALAHDLHVTPDIITGAGHFLGDEGYTKLPEVYERLRTFIAKE